MQAATETTHPETPAAQGTINDRLHAHVRVGCTVKPSPSRHTRHHEATLHFCPRDTLAPESTVAAACMTLSVYAGQRNTQLDTSPVRLDLT